MTKKEHQRSSKVRVSQLEDFEVTLRSTEPVGGQWCSWIALERSSQSMCTLGPSKQELRCNERLKQRKCQPSGWLWEGATIHTDNLGILNGVHRGEKKCIGPKAKEADFWVKIWKEIEEVRDEDIWFDVKRVRAQRTQKGKGTMLFFEEIAMEGHLGRLSTFGYDSPQYAVDRPRLCFRPRSLGGRCRERPQSSLIAHGSGHPPCVTRFPHETLRRSKPYRMEKQCVCLSKSNTSFLFGSSNNVSSDAREVQGREGCAAPWHEDQPNCESLEQRCNNLRTMRTSPHSSTCLPSSTSPRSPAWRCFTVNAKSPFFKSVDTGAPVRDERAVCACVFAGGAWEGDSARWHCVSSTVTGLPDLHSVIKNKNRDKCSRQEWRKLRIETTTIKELTEASFRSTGPKEMKRTTDEEKMIPRPDEILKWKRSSCTFHNAWLETGTFQGHEREWER